MSFRRVEEPPLFPQLEEDVGVEEQDGGVVQDGAVGGEPDRGRDERSRILFSDVIVVIGGVKPRIDWKRNIRTN